MVYSWNGAPQKTSPIHFIPNRFTRVKFLTTTKNISTSNPPQTSNGPLSTWQFHSTPPPPKAASRQVSQPIFNTIKMSPSLSSHHDCQHFRPDTDVYGSAMFAEPANGRSTTSQHVMFAFLSTWFTRPAHFARVTAATSSANDRKRVVYNGTMRARSLPPLSGIALVNRRLPSPLNITSRGKLLL